MKKLFGYQSDVVLSFIAVVVVGGLCLKGVLCL